MTNHLSWETLNDLVDGMLPPGASAAAASHARECTTCANSVAELRATLSEAHDLPAAVAPPDDLWPDVRATIEAGKLAHLPADSGAPGRGWWITPGRLAVAAALLIAVTSTLTGLVLRPGREPLVASNASLPTVAVSWQASEREFLTSVVELRAQLEVLHDHLAPETVVKVERALSTIDLAIAEGREALLRDPANAALSELLASNYRQKIELLRRMTQLASST